MFENLPPGIAFSKKQKPQNANSIFFHRINMQTKNDFYLWTIFMIITCVVLHNRNFSIMERHDILWTTFNFLLILLSCGVSSKIKIKCVWHVKKRYECMFHWRMELQKFILACFVILKFTLRDIVSNNTHTYLGFVNSIGSLLRRTL